MASVVAEEAQKDRRREGEREDGWREFIVTVMHAAQSPSISCQVAAADS